MGRILKDLETKITRVIVVKLEPGDDLLTSLSKIAKTYRIKSGFINCIGALKQFTLGYYDLDLNEYIMETFSENVELVSCIGSLAYEDEEPIIHIHISVGRRDYSVLGGHLGKPSIVSITGEVSIFEIDKKLNREINPKFGLALMKL